MIETEEQRRWWFATHPEYSWSRRGIRADSDREGGGDKVDPREVDAYVDEALKYETGPVAELLKSVKRNFGTEAELKDDLAKLEEARRADERGLEADPHTFLDVLPYRRFITSPVEAFKIVLRRTAQGQVLNATKKGGTRWKVGDDHLAPTSKGNDPVWETQRARYWKNETAKEGASEKWSAENYDRMKDGRAPQRQNPNTGELESRELHHAPTPQREGGREFIEVWPEEHARIDPCRRLKK